MASCAPAFNVLNKKWGLICACRYFSCASFKCASIKSSFSIKERRISMLSRRLSRYCLILISIWLNAPVTTPISSSDCTCNSSVSKFPPATSSAVTARSFNGLMISPVSFTTIDTLTTMTMDNAITLTISKLRKAADRRL